MGRSLVDGRTALGKLETAREQGGYNANLPSTGASASRDELGRTERPALRNTASAVLVCADAAAEQHRSKCEQESLTRMLRRARGQGVLGTRMLCYAVRTCDTPQRRATCPSQRGHAPPWMEPSGVDVASRRRRPDANPGRHNRPGFPGSASRGNFCETRGKTLAWEDTIRSTETQRGGCAFRSDRTGTRSLSPSFPSPTNWFGNSIGSQRARRGRALATDISALVVSPVPAQLDFATQVRE